MTEKKYVPKTIYRRGEAYAHTISEYIRAILDPEREFMMTRLRRALVCAMREMITGPGGPVPGALLRPGLQLPPDQLPAPHQRLHHLPQHSAG